MVAANDVNKRSSKFSPFQVATAVKAFAFLLPGLRVWAYRGSSAYRWEAVKSYPTNYKTDYKLMPPSLTRKVGWTLDTADARRHSILSVHHSAVMTFELSTKNLFDYWLLDLLVEWLIKKWHTLFCSISQKAFLELAVPELNGLVVVIFFDITQA